jgi:ketosteroid isomerase-like protein
LREIPRDTNVMERDRDEVLAANTAFYRAFAARDVDAMDALWARHAPVACVHPGWHALSGRDAVMASWRGILRGPGAPDIACGDTSIHVFGESAFVVCAERLPDGELVATNVFVREEGAWRLVHHHAGPIADADEDDRPTPGLLN